MKTPAPSAGTSQDADLARLHRPGGLPAEAGIYWPGFQLPDFGRNAGSSWRSRDGKTSLAPIIVRLLRAQHASFSSYGVNRLPQLHFFLPQRYRWAGDHKSGWRASKLIIYAHGPNPRTRARSRRSLAAGTLRSPMGALSSGRLMIAGTGRGSSGRLGSRPSRVPSPMSCLSTGYKSATISKVGSDRAKPLADSGASSAASSFSNMQTGRCSWLGWLSRPLGELAKPHVAQPAHLAGVGRRRRRCGGAGIRHPSLGPVLRDLARVYLMVIQEALPTGDENYRVVERRADGTPASIEFATYARGVP